MIKLQEATRDNLERLWKMQILAFEDLLARYRDFDLSPGAESLLKLSLRNSSSPGQNTSLSCVMIRRLAAFVS